MFEWEGRVDSEDGNEGLRWHQKVSEIEAGDETALADSVTLVGFESDLGVVCLRVLGQFQIPTTLVLLPLLLLLLLFSTL